MCVSVCVSTPHIDSYVVIVNSVVFSVAIYMTAIPIVLVHEWREDNASHIENLFESELLVETLGRLILVPDDHKWLVSALDNQSCEVLCQKYPVTVEQRDILANCL